MLISNPLQKIVLILTALPLVGWGHPEPDIPVHSTFSEDEVTIEVIIDPRSFADDPKHTPYMHNSELGYKDEAGLAALKQEGQDLMDKTVILKFDPGGRVNPNFEFDFIGLNGAALKADTDPVMLIGIAKVKVPAEATGYQMVAGKSGKLSVLFQNTLNGKKVERLNVLFPGESSFVLDISGR